MYAGYFCKDKEKPEYHQSHYDEENGQYRPGEVEDQGRYHRYYGDNQAGYVEIIGTKRSFSPVTHEFNISGLGDLPRYNVHTGDTQRIFKFCVDAIGADL